MRSKASLAGRHLRRNIVAYLALFLALGGTSAYAAGALPKASVGAKQLKRNAVTSAKVRDGSLRGTDFAPGQLPAGATGATGPVGPQGAPGAEGKQGTSGYDLFDGPPPSGTTLSGYFNLTLPLAAGKKATGAVSFPVALAPSQPASVGFAPGTDSTQIDPACSGSHNNPTAPPGHVCIYTLGSSGSTGFEVNTIYPQGFSLGFTASSNPDFVGLRAIWAYTAP